MSTTPEEREAMHQTAQQQAAVEAALKVTRDDIADVLVFMAAEDLADRSAALAGTMPDDARRALVAEQSVEVLEQLIRRHPQVVAS